ncbi:Tryprostatin B 6-hydroxylase [Cytospora mali]|uniref:Tryprostatin B 6-hydroxylase n=1 Tax=Cytospora mali TaxID=578113 RepID=A0A194WDZ4_CYTMA|nr:Tryprostatin B 6-hydroxylase [Valsa mali]
MEWCKQRMSERIKMKGERYDVSHWLIDSSLKTGSLEADREWLNGDAVTLIIAGSDTIAPTLVFAFYELAHNPLCQGKPLEELLDIDIYDRIRLQGCTYLTAVINETPRSHPPVPNGGYRQSPPGGLTIAGTYVPENVAIVSPRYSLARLECSYESADQWVPERWTTRPEMVKNSRGFAPFSQGRFSCVGKTLAMGEMRFVIALLVKRFKVEFGCSNQGEPLFGNMRDQFTASPGRLDLMLRVIEPREATLGEDGEGWVGFTRAMRVPTLFGRNYGELWEPYPVLSRSGECATCYWNRTVPPMRDILAVSMADMNRDIERRGVKYAHYWRLVDDPSAFRLLGLLPGDGDSPVHHCNLRHERREDEPFGIRYHAVSYTWGDNSLI